MDQPGDAARMHGPAVHPLCQARRKRKLLLSALNRALLRGLLSLTRLVRDGMAATLLTPSFWSSRIAGFSRLFLVRVHACQPDVFSAVVTPRRFHPLGQKHTLLLSAILAQTGQTDRQQRSYFCLHQRALPRQTVHELSSCWLVEKFQLMDCAKPNKARPITCCELDSPRALMISPRHWVFFESEPLTVGHHRPLFSLL